MAKNRETKSKKQCIISCVLCVIIIVLTICLLVLNKFYFEVDEYSIDYLKFETKNYVPVENVSNELKREDGKCSIIMSSRIEEEVNLYTMGDVIKINGKDWAKQEFEKGINWMSYHRNTIYET